MTGVCSKDPDAVPRFRYQPAVATPVPEHVISSPISRTDLGQVTETPWSSVTEIPLTITFPTFFTRYVHVIALPTLMSGASAPFVSFFNVKTTCAPK